ncbi:MAG: 23S rRNA (guanosine(2251)-2'-O)-methyltransferase RlmB [Thermoanaerobaculales bacterium]|nr:23S rRNA (guanosine(2251)-2'-O)-methyltransferase RlmB [Thermoanaerobaculales bacterium]
MSSDMWILGYHAVLSALESERPVEVLWIQAGRRDKRTARVVAAARSRRISFRPVPVARLEEVADGAPHNGCAVRSAPVSYLAIEDIVAPAERPSGLLLLDDIDDARNLGAVVRSAVAFGVDAVIVAGPSAPPLAGVAEKAAAGLLDRIPMARTRVAGDALTRLAAEGYWVFGADAAGGNLRKIKVPERWVLCIGSETKGLRAKTRSRVDEWVSIPMQPAAESLNLAVASGVLLYEFCRNL